MKRLFTTCFQQEVLHFSLLIDYVEDKNNKDGVWKGYIFAVAMFVNGVLQSFLLQYYYHTTRLLEMKIKSATIGLIYEKVKA